MLLTGEFMIALPDGLEELTVGMPDPEPYSCHSHVVDFSREVVDFAVVIVSAWVCR